MKFDVSDCRIVSTPTSEGGQLLAWQNNAAMAARTSQVSPHRTRWGLGLARQRHHFSGTGVGELRRLFANAQGGMDRPCWTRVHHRAGRVAGTQCRAIQRLRRSQGKDALLAQCVWKHRSSVRLVGPDAVYVTYLDMPGSPTRRTLASCGKSALPGYGVEPCGSALGHYLDASKAGLKNGPRTSGCSPARK